MNILQKTIRTDTEYDFINIHLSIVEVFMPAPLTPKLKELLITFIMTEKREDVMFITSNRKTVRKVMNSMSNANLSNKLGQLEEKGYIYKNEYDQYVAHRGIVPKLETQNYQFKVLYAN